MTASEHQTFEVNCATHPVDAERCSPDSTCSIRPVWHALQQRVDELLAEHLPGRPDEAGATGSGAGRDLIGELAARAFACAGARPAGRVFHFGGVAMTAVREPSVAQEPALWRRWETRRSCRCEFPGEGRGRLWLKAEWLNPGGSVKDRAARAILRDALARGRAAGQAAAGCLQRQHRHRLRHARRGGGREGDHLPARQRQPRALRRCSRSTAPRWW